MNHDDEKIKQTAEARVDMIAKGIATGVVATIIVEAGQGVIRTVAKSPWLVFGFGMVTGYYSYRYRKEIITLSNQVADQSKAFAVRQQQNLQNILASTPSSSDRDDVTE